jgi:hypothetical protein
MTPSLPMDQVASLTPDDLQIYLAGHGWIRDTTASSDLANVYRFPTLESAEALVPRLRELGDYLDRMADVVRVLAAVERRNAGQILNDLLTPSGDTVRVQLTASDATRGMLPLDEGIRLIEGARDLLLASACSVRHPAPHFPRQAFAEAVEFMRNCQLGQTERGSFIAKILAPVPPQIDRQGCFLPPEDHEFIATEPFARQATVRLMTGLKHVSNSINTGNYEQILSGVEFGVSANLCEALASMQPSGDQAQLQVLVSWSASRPRVPSGVSDPVRFSQSAFGIVREAGRRLREDVDAARRSISGRVISLKADATLLDDFVGTVILRAQLGGSSTRVQVQLDATDYKHACDAHRDGRIVTVTGVLHRELKLFHLLHPLGFRVERDGSGTVGS